MLFSCPFDVLRTLQERQETILQHPRRALHSLRSEVAELPEKVQLLSSLLSDDKSRYERGKEQIRTWEQLAQTSEEQGGSSFDELVQNRSLLAAKHQVLHAERERLAGDVQSLRAHKGAVALKINKLCAQKKALDHGKLELQALQNRVDHMMRMNRFYAEKISEISAQIDREHVFLSSIHPLYHAWAQSVDLPQAVRMTPQEMTEELTTLRGAFALKTWYRVARGYVARPRCRLSPDTLRKLAFSANAVAAKNHPQTLMILKNLLHKEPVNVVIDWYGIYTSHPILAAEVFSNPRFAQICHSDMSASMLEIAVAFADEEIIEGGSMEVVMQEVLKSHHPVACGDLLLSACRDEIRPGGMVRKEKIKSLLHAWMPQTPQDIHMKQSLEQRFQ
jgi:hypothetical protein